jgi:hypothetical protein
MAADILGKQQIRTDAKNDVQVQVADSAGSNLLAVDSNGLVGAKNYAGDGTAITQTGGAMDVNLKAQTDNIGIDIKAQTLTAVKVSATSAANTVSNPIYVELTGGAAAITNTSNALDVNVKSITGTNLPVNIAQVGGATSDATHPLFVELTDGSAAFGTSGNPIHVLEASGTGTSVKAYDKAAAVAGAGGSASHDYTVTSGKTLTLGQITVAGPGASRFEVILDAAGTPVTIDTFIIPSSGGTFTKDYIMVPITLAAGKKIRVMKTNNEKAAGATLDLYSSITGYEA